MNDAHFQRAMVLLQQGRHDLAEKELRLALAADPDNGFAHAVLALCLCDADKDEEATREGRQAVRLAPDLALGHYALGRAYLNRERLDEAEAALREAARLEPEDPDNHHLLSAVHFQRRDWEKALHAAEEGLAIDPENVGCNNMRAMALVKLGRTAEAGATLSSTLARDPENAFSHANQGWALMHEGKTKPALEHFREALRLEPGLEFARQGIIEAMKSRNIIYAVMLRYFLWMGRLSGKAQWAVVIGILFGQRFLGEIGDAYPALAPYTQPLLILLIAFVVMTWIASPLFNLLLRLDRFGRHVLSREQIVEANLVGVLLVPALVGLILWLVTGNFLALMVLAYFGLLLLPVSAVFRCAEGWPRTIMILYSVTLALIGGASFLLLFVDPEVGGRMLIAFLWGSFLSGFAANILMSMRVAR